MEFSFISYLNFLKEFVRSEKASEVLISVLQQIYALGESFQVRSIWTFAPSKIAQQKLKEFNEKRPN